MEEMTYEERLKDIYAKTCESKSRYDGKLSDLDFLNINFKLSIEGSSYKFKGSDLLMMNTTFNGKDSVLILFQVDLKKIDGVIRQTADYIMDIILCLENAFITLDYLEVTDIDAESKIVFIKAIKNKE